jgi:hypothetical protein
MQQPGLHVAIHQKNVLIVVPLTSGDDNLLFNVSICVEDDDI